MTDETDPRVIPSPATGDRDEYFHQLFKEYYRPLFYFFRRRGFSTDTCPDLTQETFLRVYRGMGGFRHEASVKTWLFRIAAHVSLNRLRDNNAAKRRGHSVPLEDGEGEDVPVAASAGNAPPTALQSLLARERVERVRSALDTLPPKMRRCVLLYIDQELKYQEIAVAMKISEGTVKSQIHEARRRLRDKLGEEFGLGVAGRSTSEGV